MTEYTVVIIGGTGQVGAAVVAALLVSSQCREVVMISRRAVANSLGERVRTVVIDTESAGFEQAVATLVQGVSRPVYGVSCVGIGSGSAKWSANWNATARARRSCTIGTCARPRALAFPRLRPAVSGLRSAYRRFSTGSRPCQAPTISIFCIATGKCAIAN